MSVSCHVNLAIDIVQHSGQCLLGLPQIKDFSSQIASPFTFWEGPTVKVPFRG